MARQPEERYTVLDNPEEALGITHDVLNEGYNARATVSDFMYYINIGAQMSRDATKRFKHEKNIAYASGARAKLDVFPATGRDNPILIVVHGGFWRAMDKKDHRFMVPLFHEHNVSTVVIGYDLTPYVPLAHIVEQVREAVIWVYQNSQKLNGDRNAIYLTGSSAGAHLCAMALSSGWHKLDVENGLIKGACLFSGLYDLVPLLYCEPNTWLGLNLDSAHLTSPIHNLPDQKMPILLAAAEQDTDLFKQQSVDYQAALDSMGIKSDYMVVPNKNHFDVFFDLANESSDSAKWLLDTIESR